MMRAMAIFTVVLALAVQAVPARAENYPIRPVTIIVPFAAGGPTDILARIVAEYFSKSLGQQFIIENVAGAGGTTGTTRAAGATADGYTLMMGNMGTHGAAPGLYSKLKYDPIKDFEPIGILAEVPILIVTRTGLPFNTLPQFVIGARNTQEKMSQAHAGVGSVSHATCAMLTAHLGVKHHRIVAYRGTGPALNDLISGQVDYMCDQIVNVVEQVRGKTITALAIAAPKRSPALPDTPTTSEAGLPDFQVSAWNALFAPSGTPETITTALNETYNKALNDETVRSRLLELGAVIPEVEARSPEALAALVRSEVERWTSILESTRKQ